MRKEVVVRLDVDAGTEDSYVQRYLEQMPFIYEANILVYNEWGHLVPLDRDRRMPLLERLRTCDECGCDHRRKMLGCGCVCHGRIEP